MHCIILNNRFWHQIEFHILHGLLIKSASLIRSNMFELYRCFGFKAAKVYSTFFKRLCNVWINFSSFISKDEMSIITLNIINYSSYKA